jgi:sarcosine oxidase subunit beta
MATDWDTMPTNTEIAIIGGGVAGLCAAWFLARAEHQVTIVERAQPWGEASGANAGTLSLQVKIRPVLALAHRALLLWEEFEATMGTSVGFARPGGLRVATSDALADALRRSANRQREEGCDTQWLDRDAAHELAPWLGPSVQAATLCHDDGFSSPLLAGPALIDAVRRAGAKLVSNAAVDAVERQADGFRLVTTDGAIACKILVIAAGPGTTRIGQMLGVNLPLYADVDMLSVTEPAPPLLDRVVTHIGGVLSLKQHPNGTILIGGGWQGRGGYRSGRKDIDHDRFVQNLRVATETVPELRRLRIVRAWAGFEAVAPDALPYLGRLPGDKNAYVAAGARGGYHLAPVQGLLLSELIRDGAASLPISAFDPGRYTAIVQHARTT